MEKPEQVRVLPESEASTEMMGKCLLAPRLYLPRMVAASGLEFFKLEHGHSPSTSKTIRLAVCFHIGISPPSSKFRSVV